jgi:hypothetical protein
MLTNLFTGSFLALGLLFAGVGGADKPRDSRAAKFASCTPDSACCGADARPGYCEEGLKCCAENKGCCAAVQECCAEDLACCKEAKACCGPTKANATPTGRYAEGLVRCENAAACCDEAVAPGSRPDLTD